ncbi:hypothetical protein FRC07_014903 [Ceratobasidium sp. 392]|nr:hypothetical protein FRC07_014903 [Ceratobasidium sp. 392]
MPEISEEMFAKLQALGWVPPSETAPPYAPPEANTTSSFVEAPKAPLPLAPSTEPVQLSAPTKPPAVARPPTLAQDPALAPRPAQTKVTVVPEPRAPVPLQRRRPNMRPVPQADASLPPAGAPPSGDAFLSVAAPSPVTAPSPAAAPSTAAAPVAPSTAASLPVPLVANLSFVPSRSATPTPSSGRATPVSRGGSRSKSTRYFRPYTQQFSQHETTMLLAELQAIRETIGNFSVNYMPTEPDGPAGRAGYKEYLAEWLGITLDQSEMLRVLVWATLMRMPGIDMHKYVTQQRPKIALWRVYEMVARVVPQFKIYEEHNYWPLKAYATATLRSSAGNHKTAIKDKDGTNPAPKSKGKGKKASPAAPESVPAEPTTQPTEVTTQPSNQLERPTGNKSNDGEGRVAGDREVPGGQGATEGSVAGGGECWARGRDGLGAGRLPTKPHPSPALRRDTRLGEEAEEEEEGPLLGNILPQSPTAGMQSRNSPPRTRVLSPGTQSALKVPQTPAPSRVLRSATTPAHTNVSTTTSTATSTATSRSTSTASATATSTVPPTPGRQRPPPPTPKSKDKLIDGEMAIQMKQILALPREVARQRFPMFFDDLTSVVEHISAVPESDEEDEPEHPEDDDAGSDDQTPVEDDNEGAPPGSSRAKRSSARGGNKGGTRGGTRGGGRGGGRGSRGGNRGGGRGRGGGAAANPAPKTRRKASAAQAEDALEGEVEYAIADVGANKSGNTRTTRSRGAGAANSGNNTTASNAATGPTTSRRKRN